MHSRPFAVRAAGVFMTSAVMFAALIVLANGLKLPGEVKQFLPTAGRELPLGDVATDVSTSAPVDDDLAVGPERSLDTSVPVVVAEPVPVVTAEPVPIEELEDRDGGDDEAVADGSGTRSGSGDDRSSTSTSRDAPPDARPNAVAPAPQRAPTPPAVPPPARKPTRPAPATPSPSPPEPSPQEEPSEPTRYTAPPEYWWDDDPDIWWEDPEPEPEPEPSPAATEGPGFDEQPSEAPTEPS